MYRKSISIIVSVCLLALSNYALASNWNGGGTAHDWFDAGNWNEGLGPVPDFNNGEEANIEAKSPMPWIPSAPGEPCDVNCNVLNINPWMWEYGPEDCNFVINDGRFDTNCVSLGGRSLQYAQPGWTDTPAVLYMNGGLLAIDETNSIPMYEDEDNPPMPGYGGRGLWIGGGSSSWMANWGNVIVNSGTITTPRIAIYNGDITLNGGLVYDTCDSPTQFVIRTGWARNKIYINGGTLGLAGNRVSELNNYINAQRIVSPRGVLVGPTYTAGKTTLTADVNLGKAWQPSPAHLDIDVHYHPTGGVNLSWRPGDWIGEPNINEPNNGHYVFLGTSQADVTNAGVGPAGTASAVYKGHVANPSDVNNDPNIDIPEANFVERKDYYWRVDEVNDPCNHKGLIWRFKTVGSKASNPSPADVVGGLKMPLQLTWTAGDWSPTTHWVYFGTSSADVGGAVQSDDKPVYRGTVSSPVYALSKLLEAPGYTLAPDTIYYWRVDEADSKGRQPGETGCSGLGGTWSFNTGSSVSVDDFQEYETTTDLNSVWLEDVPVGACNKYGTGTLALIREGQSGKYMRFTYKKGADTAAGEYNFSEVDRAYSGNVNFTGGGVLDSAPRLLELAYRGAATNSVDPTYDRMYVVVEDSSDNVSISQNPDANAQLAADWEKWAISYDQLVANSAPATVDMSYVTDLYLGFGVRCRSLAVPGGDGNVMFDDFRVLSSTCVPKEGPAADLDGNCVVNVSDLDALASFWLAQDEDFNFLPNITSPNTPVLWYKFDETIGSTCADSGKTGTYIGTVQRYIPMNWNSSGHNGGCLYIPPIGPFPTTNQSYVSADPCSLGFMSDTNHPGPGGGGVSFTMWANASLVGDFLVQWPGIFGIWNAASTVETVEVPCPVNLGGGEGQVGFFKRTPSATASTYLPLLNFGGRWNHWAFIKEPYKLLIYCNGNLVAHTDANGLPGDPNVNVYGPLFSMPVGQFRIGTRGDNWAMWSGKIDDFKVFDYALSDEEVAYIATDGTGLLHLELTAKANLKHDEPIDIVNFGDLSKMCDEWLTEKLWPPD